MENFIRSNAENIWELLCERGQMTLRQIGDHTHCRDTIIFMSIGYLVKEDKINIRDFIFRIKK
ncbi:MAG: winged helix-turn-helix domain-containing protein [Prevotella sp.]|nr:winged helix-turn-helix domain-containing protein [Prevotella sp.]